MIGHVGDQHVGGGRRPNWWRPPATQSSADLSHISWRRVIYEPFDVAAGSEVDHAAHGRLRRRWWAPLFRDVQYAAQGVGRDGVEVASSAVVVVGQAAAVEQRQRAGVALTAKVGGGIARCSRQRHRRNDSRPPMSEVEGEERSRMNSATRGSIIFKILLGVDFDRPGRVFRRGRDQRAVGDDDAVVLGGRCSGAAWARRGLQALAAPLLAGGDCWWCGGRLLGKGALDAARKAKQQRGASTRRGTCISSIFTPRASLT